MAASDQAQQLRDDGKWKRAREQFRACARDACPQVIRQDCQRWLGEVDQGFPTIVLVVRDEAGADVTDVNVLVDGQPFVAKIDGRPVEIDPGEHTVRAEAPGRAAVEQRITVHAGEKNRVVKLTVGAASATAPAPTVPAPAASTIVASPPAPHRSPLPFVIGGVGALAIGSFAFFGITGKSQLSDLRGQPCAQTATCAQSDVDAVRTKFIVADVSLVIGVAGLAVATWLFLREPSRSGPNVAVAPVQGGAVVGIGGALR